MCHLFKAEELSGQGGSSSLWAGTELVLMPRPKMVRPGCLGKSLVGWAGWSGLEVGKDDCGVRSQKALSLTLYHR